MADSQVSQCPRCGAKSVRPRARAGRTWRYRMLVLCVPGDFQIPTCGRCHSEYVDRNTADALSLVMEAEYAAELRRRAQRAIGQVTKYISQRQLEILIGLSQGYLSRLLAGVGTPSATLVALLTLIADMPDVREHLDRMWTEPSGASA